MTLARMPTDPGTATVVEVPAPLTVRDAMPFGRGHALAILDQAARGLRRTVPMWLIAGAARAAVSSGRRPGPTAARAGRPPLARVAHPAIRIVRDALLLQALWPVGYASFSGARTVVRLTRLGRDRVLPLEIHAATGGVMARASAYRGPMGTAWHVEGVFAWPRRVGGGSAVLARLLGDADDRGDTLVLTALSPRVARAYERVGFRKIAWIYWMRRDPKA